MLLLVLVLMLAGPVPNYLSLIRRPSARIIRFLGQQHERIRKASSTGAWLRLYNQASNQQPRPRSWPNHPNGPLALSDVFGAFAASGHCYSICHYSLSSIVPFLLLTPEPLLLCLLLAFTLRRYQNRQYYLLARTWLPARLDQHGIRTAKSVSRSRVCPCHGCYHEHENTLVGPRRQRICSGIRS